MGKLSILYSYLNFSSAIGLISVIFGLVLFLIINKPLTKIFFKGLDKVEDIIGETEDTKIKKFLLGDENSRVYGPNNLLKYHALLNFIIAVQFIIMGVVYILSEKNQINIYRSIKKCLNIESQ